LRRAKQSPQNYPWLAQLLARRPFKVVAIALANKMARVAWALLIACRGSRQREKEDSRWEDEVASMRFMNCKG